MVSNEGFCKVELKPFGPVQLYVAPVMVEAERVNVLPLQTGVLLLNVGTGAVALILIFVERVEELQLFIEIYNEYSPPSVADTFVLVGF
jgi:hypothetical protein